MEAQLSEMVERVSKAIWDGLTKHGAGDLASIDEVARLAIAAMREPTQEMYAAADKVGIDMDPETYWQAMVDEALR